jgi:hypothetical protein
MRTPILRALPLAAGILVAATVSLAAAADGVKAIVTPGSGMLTMCRNRLVYSDCNSYHHIAIPGRIAVGDKFQVEFGSNPKGYEFPVVRIVRNGDSCTLLSEAGVDAGKSDTIEVASCRDASGPN